MDANADEPVTLPPLSAGDKWVLTGLGLASGGLAGLAFTSMFTVVRDAMRPSLHQLAWIVPIYTDLGLLIISVFDVFLEIKQMPAWWLRWAAALFVGFQLSLNVSSADGDRTGAIGHAGAVAAYVVTIEIWRFFFRRRRNLAAAKRRRDKRDRIPVARYLAAWDDSMRLRSFMILWGVNRLEAAMAMRQRVVIAEATLKRILGHLWREDTDPELLAMLYSAIHLDEACERIRKMAAADQRDKTQRPAPDKSGRPETPAKTAGDCCEPHKTIAAGRKLPRTAEAARQVNAQHRAAHGTVIGAEPLRKLFGIKSNVSRALRDWLAGEPAAGVPDAFTELPGPGRVGSTGSGRVDPAGLGRVELPGTARVEPAGLAATGSVNGTGGGA